MGSDNDIYYATEGMRRLLAQENVTVKIAKEMIGFTSPNTMTDPEKRDRLIGYIADFMAGYGIDFDPSKVEKRPKVMINLQNALHPTGRERAMGYLAQALTGRSGLKEAAIDAEKAAGPSPEFLARHPDFVVGDGSLKLLPAEETPPAHQPKAEVAKPKLDLGGWAQRDEDKPTGVSIADIMARKLTPGEPGKSGGG